jgi:hypothetical protein
MTKQFFSPLKMFCEKFNIKERDCLAAKLEDKKVTIPLMVSKTVILAAISDLEIDLHQYAAQNPDVAKAFDSRPPNTHRFKNAGYFEGRSIALEFDQAFYFSRNPGIAIAVKLLSLNARDYYIDGGIYEHKVPNALADAEVEC